MNTNEYHQFENACITEMQAKQEKTAEILLFNEMEMDKSKETIRFLEEGELFMEAAITFIGSHSHKSGSWMWAWANPLLEPFLRSRSVRLKELGTITDNAEFLNENSFVATERQVRVFVAIACHHLGGIGVYTTSTDDIDWFFLIINMKYLKTPEVFLSKAQNTAANVLLEGQGADLLNLLRKRFPEIKFNYAGADLRGAAQPWAHDLHAQILFDLDYMPPHKTRDLSGANLSGSRFDGAIMRGILLSGALFDSSSLVDADLSGADLRGASFRNAFLNGVNFTRANLEDADFTGAELSRTLLNGVDLSKVKGLEEVRHLTGSEISLSTLISSHFQITPTFLRKAGVSRGLLEDFARGKRFSKTYQTCFLSYTSKDREFATQLYNSLVKAGVRVFWDHFDVIPGEFLEDQIVEAIREHDRLLVVLSPQSMASKWVVKEIELAWSHKRESLLPIRLCPTEEVRQWTKEHEKLPKLASLLPLLNFSEWKIPEEYGHALSLLLKSFAGGVDFGSNEDE